jgi:hypothetical protein
MAVTFKGRARRLDDVDLPREGARIGVGEDEVHAVLEVEARGSGYDSQGRVAMLFEPHVFWRELGAGPKRDRAEAEGLAYPKWGTRPYPADSYPRLLKAKAIDETAALRSASWGLGQILGANHLSAGFMSPQAMVTAFADDEEAQLRAMVNFIKWNKLDDDIRRHDWAGFARGYNGPQFAKHNYHGRLAAAFAKWSRVRDTPWTPEQSAAETAENDTAARNVAFPPPAPKPAPKTPALPPDVPKAEPPAPAPRKGFWGRFWDALIRRTKGA